MCENEEKVKLEYIFKNMQSTERMNRQNALKEFKQLIEKNGLETITICEIFDISYLHIFKCYSDKYETCRRLACELINEIVKKLPDNDYYLGYIIPIITKRIGQKEIIEESEEMRLSLVNQLVMVIEKFKSNEKTGDRFIKTYNDIMDILIKTLVDPYPIIQRESCNVLKCLAIATPSFHYRAEALVNPLINMLRHRHYSNRISAIEALGITSLHILSNGERLVKIITEISPLLMDSMPQVRRECGRVGCLMLLDLKDRYSFFERILPLVLCCLTDDFQETRTEIMEKWEECGRQYFLENENELAKLELVDHLPNNYPENVKRPTLGCRAIMQRSLRMIKLVIREMGDWKEDVRIHSLKLLEQAVLHSEKALTAMFIDIYPVLAISCMDTDERVVNEAIQVSKLIGQLLEYNSWIDHALSGLEKYSKLGILRCFRLLYTGAAANDKYIDVSRIAGIISNPAISHKMDKEFQNELLLLSEHLISLMLSDNIKKKDEIGDHNIRISAGQEYLYTVLVKVICLADTDDEIGNKGKEILNMLATDELSVADLHKTYGIKLLYSIEDLDARNTAVSETVLLLSGFIKLCGFQKIYMVELKKAISIVLENALPDAQIKIFSAISISMLNWNSTMKEEFDENLGLLTSFINDIIIPVFTWKAGRSAESIRAMAISSLCSATQGAPEETSLILPELAQPLINLVDDNNIATRSYALRTIMKSGPISIDQLKPLTFAILARLDDPSNEVREIAAKCLGFLKLKDAKPDENDSWNNICLKQVFSTILLHMDDSEIKLRSILIESAELLGKQSNKVFFEVFNNVPAAFPYEKEIDQMKENVLN